MSENDAMLVPIEPSALALDFFTGPAGPDAIIEAVREKVSDFAADTTTATGRAAIKSLAYKVTRTKTAVDDIGKALVAEYKAIPAKIDATRKRLRDELDAIKDEVRRPLTEWENAEKDRVSKIKERVEWFERLAEAKADGSAEIFGWIDTVQKIEIDDSFEELQGEAAIAKDSALTRLRERHAAAVNREAVEAERRQRERLEAVNEAVETERRRIEAEAERARQVEAQRVADSAHRFEIHRAILKDIISVTGLDDDRAMDLLDAIRDGGVRYLRIEY